MKIGFIGLGIMGSRMAANLLKNGVNVLLHNRTKEKAQPLLDMGGTWAEQTADFAQVDLLITMLAHPQAVTAVTQSENSALSHLPQGALWIDCSTVDHLTAKQSATVAHKQGLRFLEAPVAGSKPQAQQGELVFFAGGHASDLEEARPYLDMMGKKVVHVGEHGAGASLKLVINSLLASSMASFAEAVALGQGLGLAQETLLNVLLGGVVTAPYLSFKKEMFVSGEYDAQFPLRWMQKDMHLVSIAGYNAGIPLPLANLAKEIFQSAVADGLGDEDFSVLYKHITDG